MRKLIALAILVPVLTTACRRELSTESNNLVNDHDGLLKMTATFYSGDSAHQSISTFTYDDNDRLIRVDGESPMYNNGNIVGKGHNYMLYIRDDNGKLLKRESYTVRQGLPDLLLKSYSITYESGTNNHIAYFPDSNFKYFYGVSDHIVKVTVRQQVPQNTGPFLLTGYTDYSYDNNGNITKVEIYKMNADGSSSHNISFSYEYDNKINPFPLEPVNLQAQIFWTSHNNVVRQKNDYFDPTEPNDEINYTYQYNRFNQPVYQESTDQYGSVLKTYYYYY